MMSPRVFAPILALVFLTQTIASAQSPPPPTFVYNVKMSAGAGSGSTDYKMDVAITSTQPDGTRQATLTIHWPKMMEVDNKSFAATLSPFGAVTVASTGEMPKNYNPMNIAAAKQMEQAAEGPMVGTMINPMNAFANGFASAPSSLKPGTTWQAFSREANANVKYTVTAREQVNGRDTVAVRMQTPSTTGSTVTGQGNYDPAAHLVVSVHSEIRPSADSKAAQIVDVAMANP